MVSTIIHVSFIFHHEVDLGKEFIGCIEMSGNPVTLERRKSFVIAYEALCREHNLQIVGNYDGNSALFNLELKTFHSVLKELREREFLD